MAALVHKVSPDSVDISLVSTDVLETRTLIIQAGCTTATFGDGRTLAVDGKHLQVKLAPGAQVDINLGMVLHASTDPSYLRPWDDPTSTQTPQSQSIRSMAEATSKL